ncbi:hypothetical protein AB0M95_37860 [Sphaerisporangium sp. NPDC051017]|uniref:hypothetical protein n=1 Tax=Sphaerisporangium sp. NPDC051017 TaxID=3154636 RepID=UPI00341A55C9
MKLADLAGLALSCRESTMGFEAFRTSAMVSSLRWPADVVEQFLYDHADNDAFLRDYENIDLSTVRWEVTAVPVEEFMVMPTGASDGDCIEEYAADPGHWVRVRNRGIHMGVAECWETHGTWKRWPILIDRMLLDPPEHGLQVLEGRTRVGVMRGRRRQGALVAERHLAWVGRSSSQNRVMRLPRGSTSTVGAARPGQQ